MKTIPVFLLSFMLLSCSTPPPKAPSFADSFVAMPAKDTVLFAVAQGLGTEAPLPSADTLDTAVFYEQVPDSLRAMIEHMLASEEPVIVKLGRFPLDAQFDGLGIAIKDFWFLNQSILIYDKQLQRVTDLFPVAEYYGGDGGQVLRQSWWITAANGAQEWIVRDSGHSLILNDNAEEPEDVYSDVVARYVWQNGSFVLQPVPDSTALIQQFPVTW